jgi:hypothetical protein
METKLHGAFEFICAENNFSANEIIHAPQITDNILVVGPSLDVSCLHTKGTYYYEHIATGNKILIEPGQIYEPGKWEPGEYKVIFDSDWQYFCVNSVANPEYYPVCPKISLFKLLTNESVEIEQGKKLFLATGSLNIGDKNYSGINRIRFTTGNKTVTAVEDSYGFFVEI